MASIIKADTLQSTTANVFILNSSGTEYARFDSTGVFQLTNPTTFPAGTVSLPSITATGDTNTGLYFPAADTIAFSEGGTEVMRIDSDGDVGIGTTTPGKKLDILSNTSQDGIRISGSANPRLTIIDTTTPVQFDVLCTDTEVVLRSDTNHPMVFSTNGTERARINADGGLRTQVTGGGSIMETFGCRAWVNFNGTGTVAIRASGNVTSITDNGTGDYTVNFTTAMPDANYSMNASCSYRSGNYNSPHIFTQGNGVIAAPTTTAARMQLSTITVGSGDSEYVSVAIFR